MSTIEEQDSEGSEDNAEECLFDESYESEIRIGKRRFYLNRLDRTDISERWVEKICRATSLHNFSHLK